MYRLRLDSSLRARGTFSLKRHTAQLMTSANRHLSDAVQARCGIKSLQLSKTLLEQLPLNISLSLTSLVSCPLNFAEIFGIRKLDTLSIVWHCLRDPMFNRLVQYSRVSDRQEDGRTDRQTVGQTHDDSIYRASIASRVKMVSLHDHDYARLEGSL